jgi:arylsulfatase A-like enzyme
VSRTENLIRHSTRRFLVLAICIASVILGGCREEGTPPASSGRPNIVLIYADDVDFDQIGVYDHRVFPSFSGAAEADAQLAIHNQPLPASRVLTPNIDSLARDGALFTRYYVTSSVCTASRYSALTGRFASRSQPFQEIYPEGKAAQVAWNTTLGPAESSVAKTLKSLGYRTGLVGKWHLTDQDTMRVSVRRRDAGHPSEKAVAERLVKEYEWRRQYVGETYGFDSVESFYVGNPGSEGLHDALRYHNMDWVTQGAMDFLDEYENDHRPFFLYLAPTLLHGPYQAGTMESDSRATPRGFVDIRQVQPSRDDVKARVAAAGYKPETALSTWLDDAVGAVMRNLEEKQIADNTLIVFVSDNLSRGKYTLYEGTRVPALMKWPRGIKPGTQIEALSANIDLAPTFISIAGGDSGREHMDGVDLWPVLSGRSEGEVREALLLEVAYARAVIEGDWKYIAVRYPRKVWKRIRLIGDIRKFTWNGRALGSSDSHPEDKIRFNANRYFPNYSDLDQLYNLGQDPLEQINLASDPAHGEQLARMQRLLSRNLESFPHSFGEFKKPRER